MHVIILKLTLFLLRHQMVGFDRIFLFFWTASTSKRSFTPEMNVIGHTHARFKRSKGVKLNGILEWTSLPKNEHRTVMALLKRLVGAMTYQREQVKSAAVA
jgi:hypothetical protein